MSSPAAEGGDPPPLRQRIFAALLSPLQDPCDSDVEARRKTVVAYLGGAFAPACTIYLVFELALGNGIAGRELLLLAGLIAATAALGGYGWVAVTRRASEGFVSLLWAVGIAVCCMVDTYNASHGLRSIGLFVLCIDGLMVCDVRRGTVVAAVAATTAWCALLQLEFAFRFGLLDVWGTYPASERAELFCACDVPPCEWGAGRGWGVFVASMSFLLMNFYAFSGFLDSAAARQRSMAAAVGAAQAVASELANYDLEAAARGLESHGTDLPSDLHDALQTILRNLEAFRPFLPPSIFAGRAAAADSLADIAAHPVPGVASAVASQDSFSANRRSLPRQSMCLVAPDVAILFTDIRSSTALWNHAPHAMRQALKMHNQVIRAALTQHGGYEVKVVGDSFMASFEHALNACLFGLQVTGTFLLDTAWPAGLTRGDAQEEDGWDVLLLRMGVHYGPVDVEQNFLTGRWDYFGATVNKAARVEGLGVPGALTVTECVYDRVAGGVEPCLAIPLQQCVIARGFEDEELWLTVLLPDAVRGCAKPSVLSHVEKVTRVCRELVRKTSVAPEGPATASDEGLPCFPSLYNSHPNSLYAGDAFSFSCHQSASYNSLVAKPPVIQGTVAYVAVRPAAGGAAAPRGVDHTRVCHALQHAMLCLERAKGVCENVINATMITIWGTTPASLYHVRAAFRFLYLLESTKYQSTAAAGMPVFTGVATGEMLPAQVVGTQCEKFVTTMSPVLDMAAMACAAALELGAFAMWSTTAYADRPRADGLGRARVLDRWVFREDAGDDASSPHGGAPSPLGDAAGISASTISTVATPSTSSMNTRPSKVRWLEKDTDASQQTMESSRTASSRRESAASERSSRSSKVVFVTSDDAVQVNSVNTMSTPSASGRTSTPPGPSSDPVEDLREAGSMEVRSVSNRSLSTDSASKRARSPRPRVIASRSPPPPLRDGDPMAGRSELAMIMSLDDVASVQSSGASTRGSVHSSHRSSHLPVGVGFSLPADGVLLYQVGLVPRIDASFSAREKSAVDGGDDEACEAAWGAPWHDAFAARNTAQLRALAQEDPIALRACTLLDAGRHLTSRNLGVLYQ